MLFEKQVLQSTEWKQQLKIKDFECFVDSLQQIKFRKVLNQRSSKVQTFRHPGFRKDSKNALSVGGHEEREKAKRKRKAKEDENAGFSDGVAIKEENYSKNLEKKPKQHRAVVLEDNNIRTESKRKRNPENREEVSTHGKEQKAAVLRAPIDPIADKTPGQQLL